MRVVAAAEYCVRLITSSIMSKKIASGSHNIVLDVKVGSGAFMKTPEEAEILAEKMVEIGKGCGRNIAAVLTDMDSPLGNSIGNALEVAEAVAVLKNEKKGDLRDVCVALASEMVSLVFGCSHDEAERKVITAIESGTAFNKMKQWIAAQGGDISQIDNTSLLPQAKFSTEVICEADGYITAMNAEEIGKASVMLGAGRASKETEIDYAAGIVIDKKVGDKVCRGDRLATLFYDNGTPDNAIKCYLSAVKIETTAKEKQPLIYKIIR